MLIAAKVLSRMVNLLFRSSLRLILPAMLAVASRYCLAHTSGLSTSEFRLTTNGLQAELILAGADFAYALARLDAATPSDANRDGTLSAEEVTMSLTRVRKFAAESLALDFAAHSPHNSLQQHPLRLYEPRFGMRTLAGYFFR